MPTLSITPALRQVYASAPAGVDIWPTLELSHPLWTQTYYLTSAPAAFTATLESGPSGKGPTVTFQPFPFAVVLPTVDGAGQQDLSVTLTNADQAIADAVQAAHADPTQRITCVYREFLSTGDATQLPQSPPIRLAFDSIQITEEAVTGIAGRSDVLNRRFPGIWYSASAFPGLDR
jgi:Domain of unknown function (DUF1833)